MHIYEISVIIPAYNEAKRLGSTLERINNFLSLGKYDYEIIVVDDGSKDNTAEIVAGFAETNKKIRLLKNPKNKGKGYSVRNGILNAKKEHILFSDADLSTPIEELDKFIPFLSKYEIVIGSRRMKHSQILIKQPWYRTIPGRIFPLLVNIMILPKLKDTQCGFKLFKKKTARFLFSKQIINGFSFDVEVLYLARKYKIKVKEVPIVWSNDTNSKLNPIRDSYRMFIELLKIKINDIKGKYNNHNNN